jgi:hypothetical protein
MKRCWSARAVTLFSRIKKDIDQAVKYKSGHLTGTFPHKYRGIISPSTDTIGFFSELIHQPSQEQNTTNNTLAHHSSAINDNTEETRDLCKFCDTLGLRKDAFRCANCKRWRYGKRSSYNKQPKENTSISTANLPQAAVNIGTMIIADQNQDTSNCTVRDDSHATAQDTTANSLTPNAAAGCPERIISEPEMLTMSDFCLPNMLIWYPEAEYPSLYPDSVPPCKWCRPPLA